MNKKDNFFMFLVVFKFNTAKLQKNMDIGGKSLSFLASQEHKATINVALV